MTERRDMPRWALLLALTVFSACPAVNSTPCESDDQCSENQRCRRGACGPICLSDEECGDDQVCSSAGVCTSKPECDADDDCSAGFTCTAGRCACTGDSSCASNQVCRAGTCQTRARCKSSADCTDPSTRCEVTQGLCVPACTSSAECAPNLDPQIANVLYACVEGACTRRCTTDIQCGTSGVICLESRCRASDCETFTDCHAGSYCTSATYGRCKPYTTCSSTAECGRNEQCRSFGNSGCPPGFDCALKICQELPRCLADGDCTTGIPGTPTAQQTGYCQEGHCQATVDCEVPSHCKSSEECVAKVCVPLVCRGPMSCAADKVCVGGTCDSRPIPQEIALLRVTPKRLVLEKGDTATLSLIGFRLNGSSAPLNAGTYSVVDANNQPSSVVTVSSAGLVTALAAGSARIKASLSGSSLTPVEAEVVVIDTLAFGRRVVVIDASTQRPIEGAAVRVCTSSSCASPLEVTTNIDGVALFPTAPTTAITISIASTQLRTDGLPRFERATFLNTTAPDVVVPLRENTVRSAAGFNASISFAQVKTSGAFWTGFAAASISDLPSLSFATLVGDSFAVDIPGSGQRVPIPSAVVLYASPGFSIAQKVKDRAYGFASPGVRTLSTFAGRADITQFGGFRSIDVLSYLSSFDYALEPNVDIIGRSLVDDTTDVDGDRQCSDSSRCPGGSENVPDYGNFTKVSLTPNREQLFRTEVVLPSFAQAITTVVVIALGIDQETGAVPLGFASRTPIIPSGSSGERTVQPFTLKSGAPYAGLETSLPAVWTIASTSDGQQTTSRLFRAATMPQKITFAPFLPMPSVISYNASTRTLALMQPTWSSVFSSGGEFARLELSGAEQRHAVYFAVESNQTSVALPPPMTSAGTDPLTSADPNISITVFDLTTGVSVDEVQTLAGASLLSLPYVIDGYSRFDR